MTVRTNQWLKNYFMERDPDDYNRDLVDTFGNLRASNGVTIFVNSAANGGDDDNPGTDPLAPKLTIGGTDGAISLCTDSDDVVDNIIVGGLPGDTFPITIDAARTNVIGYPAPGFYSRIRLDARTAVEDVFVVASNWVLIQGFETRAGAGKAGIQVSTTNVHRCCFRDNYFGFGAYGVLLDGTAGGGHHVVENYFQGSLTDGGIYSVAGYQLRYERNVFGNLGAAVKCIYVMGVAGDGMILDNTFALGADAADGLAITIGHANVANWIIAGNRANYGKATMTQNPYLDVTTANHWMQNWKGTTETDPA